jgi:hypothetical protein
MTVKIARLRSGEDVIADFKEVINKDTNNPTAIQFDTPYMVGIEGPTEDLFANPAETGTKISRPRVRFFPWTPLSKDRIIYVEPIEVVCIYEPHQQVLDQYRQLVEAMDHGGINGYGGAKPENTFPD